MSPGGAPNGLTFVVAALAALLAGGLILLVGVTWSALQGRARRRVVLIDMDEERRSWSA